EQPPCAAADCIMDPFAHCVKIAACTSSVECPAGTYCPETDSRRRGQHDVTVQRACTPLQMPLESATSLTAGFRVQEMSFHKDSEEGAPAVFSGTVPDGAIALSCALFGCLPEFEDVGAVSD